MNNNGLGIDIPVLKGQRVIEPGLGTLIRAGWCFEPFVSLINHSCEPNAWWVFEGKELRVRAATNILAGVELTFTYVGDRGEYGKRRDQLETHWGIACTCIVCKKGNVGTITSSLRNTLRKLDLNNFSSAKSPAEFAGAISEMMAAGHDYDTHPMRALHQQMAVRYVASGDIAPALQALLKVRYLIEPYQSPSIHPKDRLSTLFNIVTLMNLPLRDTTGLKLKFPPGPILDLNKHLLFHLKYQYVEEVEKCFGLDSVVAKFEKRELNVAITDFVESTGFTWYYTPLNKSADETRKFVKNMNTLLAWADISARTEKQLTNC
jgi:hypothetical protein